MNGDAKRRGWVVRGLIEFGGKKGGGDGSKVRGVTQRGEVGADVIFDGCGGGPPALGLYGREGSALLRSVRSPTCAGAVRLDAFRDGRAGRKRKSEHGFKPRIILGSTIGRRESGEEGLA